MDYVALLGVVKSSNVCSVVTCLSVYSLALRICVSLDMTYVWEKFVRKCSIFAAGRLLTHCHGKHVPPSAFFRSGRDMEVPRAGPAGPLPCRIMLTCHSTRHVTAAQVPIWKALMDGGILDCNLCFYSVPRKCRNLGTAEGKGRLSPNCFVCVYTYIYIMEYLTLNIWFATTGDSTVVESEPLPPARTGAALCSVKLKLGCRADSLLGAPRRRLGSIINGFGAPPGSSTRVVPPPRENGFVSRSSGKTGRTETLDLPHTVRRPTCGLTPHPNRPLMMRL
jgi:hypothetical protein